MPDDKDLLENMDENSMSELDSLEGFAEIDDLSLLEGIEEFQDLDDLGDLDIPLPDDVEGELSAIQDEVASADNGKTDGIADAIGEMTGKAPSGLFEDSEPEEEESAPVPELSEDETAVEPDSDEDASAVAGTMGEMTGTAPTGLFEDSTPLPEDDADAMMDVMDALDDTAEEMPLPEEDNADAMTDVMDALDDMVEEMPLPEEDNADAMMDVMDALDDMAEEMPLPEEDNADAMTDLMDALDDTAEEMPLPEEDDADAMTDVMDALDDTAEEMPLPEEDNADAMMDVMDALDDTAEELPLPEEDGEDALMDALDDTAEEMPLPELGEDNPEAAMDAAMDAIDDMMTDIPMPEEDGDVDNMLDGLLDDLALMEDASETDLPEGSAAENPEDASDLLDLLENSEDTLMEDDIDEVLNIGLPETESEKESKEQEPGLLKKLFGNVVNDEIAEAERKAMEEEEAAAAEKAEQDAVRKEEKEAEKAEKEEQKAARKAAKAEQKAAKKAAKEAAKAEKKAKKEEEAAKEEQFEVTGKLNKVGVAIIVIFTVVFLTAEILGTNIHGVSRAKRAANSYFELGKYTQAYQEILGTDLKKKDPDTYNKIKTVMQVQRSINAYNNYNEMNYYPDALNALLRGIQRYDANLESAKELDVVSDMDQCKAQILSLLNSEFGVSEGEAYALLALEKSQYDSQVVQLAMSR